MGKYYVLGVGYKKEDTCKKYPYEIWMSVNENKYPLVILEGKGTGGVGGSFGPSNLLENTWKENIEITSCQWLLPLCELAMNNDGILDVNLVVEEYKYRHGYAPHISC